MASVHLPLYSLALDLARQKIEGGWTQGAYWRSESGATDCLQRNARRVDLAHALEHAATVFEIDGERLRLLVLGELDEPYRSDYTYGLERWNDQPMRTKNDVLMLLDRVARNAT